MPSLLLPRLPTAAVLCGAALLGWSLDGVASVDAALRAAPTQVQDRPGHLVSDREARRHVRADRREL